MKPEKAGERTRENAPDPDWKRRENLLSDKGF
jgi:hypothetical protein